MLKYNEELVNELADVAFEAAERAYAKGWIGDLRMGLISSITIGYAKIRAAEITADAMIEAGRNRTPDRFD